jgi:hypothetical protein
MNRRFFASVLALSLLATPALAEGTAAPAGAKVYFIGLETGAKVKSPLVVRFGLAGMGIAPAGVEKEATGHHHLLVDAPLTPAELDQPLPADDKHVHFGKGQTETSLKLAPGRHTLQLVLADHQHIPHKPAVISDVITIDVEE